MFFVRSLPAPLHSSFRVLPRVPRNGGPRTGAFFVSGTAFLLSLAPSVGEVASLGTAFGGRGLPRPRTFSLFRPRFPSPTVCPKTVAPVLGDFCEWGGAPCARFSASRPGGDTLCARFSTFRRECAAREGLVFGERSFLPRYSSFCDPFLLSGRFPPKPSGPPSRGLFCEWGGASCARFSTSRRGCAARDGRGLPSLRPAAFPSPSFPVPALPPAPVSRRVQQKFNSC